MPYLFLAVGAALGVFGLYRFFLNATPKQAGLLVLAILTFVLAGALLLLTLSGRLPAALAVLLALWPIGVTIWKSMRGAKKKPGPIPPSDRPLSREDALDILGLRDPVTPGDIQSAYKRLMMKLHPDQDGSEWLAAKLNAARDLLLK